MINLGFLLRENLLLCSSYLPLGVPNWVVTLLASTSDTEERVNLDRRRRRGNARSSAGTWGNSGRCPGLVLTSQGAVGVPLC
jgi:hypothetical protein